MVNFRCGVASKGYLCGRCTDVGNKSSHLLLSMANPGLPMAGADQMWRAKNARERSQAKAADSA